LTDYDKLLAATLSSAFEQKQEIPLFLYNLQNNFCALKPFVTPILFSWNQKVVSLEEWWGSKFPTFMLLCEHLQMKIYKRQK
jgi:hypothetical protein